MTTRGLILDARVSMAAFAAVVVVSTFAVSSIAAMAVVLAYVVLLFLVAVGGLGRLLARLAGIAWVAVLIVVLNAALVRGSPLVAVGGRTILSLEGLHAGFLFCLRLLVLYLAMVVFLAVTPPAECARGLHTITRPFSARFASDIAFHAFVVLSFLPVFADEYERIRTAQSFRGATLRGGLLRRAADVRLLVVPLVVSAIVRSAQLAAVVELRGLKPRMGEALPARALSRIDYAVAAVTIAVLAAAAVLSRRSMGA
jgi:energy-coupling factor transporter transmembrane protein EcfT